MHRRRGGVMSVEHPDQDRDFPDGRPADEQPAWRARLPDRLAGRPLRRAPRVHQVPGPDQPGVRRRPAAGSGSRACCVAVGSRPRRGPRSPGWPTSRSAASGVPLPGPGGRRACCCGPTSGRSSPTASSAPTSPAPSSPASERGELHCPCHVGYFDLATGRPIAGPPRRPLPRIALEVRDGIIYATGVEERTT